MEIKHPVPPDQRTLPVGGPRLKTHFLVVAFKALVFLFIVVILAVSGLRLVFTLPDRKGLEISSTITASTETWHEKLIA